MLPFLINLYQFFRSLWKGLQDPEFRALFALVVLLLLTGSVFYHLVEQFTWLNALYFSVMTLTTVGDGNVAPHTVAGKIFTMLYIFVGFGVILSFLTAIAQHARDQRMPQLSDFFRKTKHNDA